jgi:hypothetical protein
MKNELRLLFISLQHLKVRPLALPSFDLLGFILRQVCPHWERSLGQV